MKRPKGSKADSRKKTVIIANATFQRQKWWIGPREARLEPYGAGYRWVAEEIGYVGSIGSAKGLVLWALNDGRFSLVSSRIDARWHFESE